MKREWVIGVVVGGCAYFLLKQLSVRLHYGITSKWKIAALKIAVPQEVPRISVAEAYRQKEDFIFLDTRSREEFVISHIPGAQFVPYKEFALTALKEIPKSTPIITYCSIGKRSGLIGKKLLEAGFTNVYNLYGGIFEWVNRELPVVDTENKRTKKVHTFSRAWSVWLEKGIAVY